MKNSKYNRHMGKIKCTDEFKLKMEDMLSPDTDGEYADTVSHVEQAPKWNVSRYGALAASAVLLVGMGGGAVMLAKQASGEVSSGSELSVESSEYPVDYKGLDMSAWRLNEDMEEERQDIVGPMPEDTSAKVIDLFNSADGELIYENAEELITPAKTTILDFYAIDGTKYSVSESGTYFIAAPDAESVNVYGADGLFDEVLDTVAHDLINFTWDTLYDGVHGKYYRTGERISVSFQTHMDEIELTDDTEISGDSTLILDRFPYMVNISTDGKLLITYDKSDGSEGRVAYNVPYNLVTEILTAIAERENVEGTLHRPAIDDEFIKEFFSHTSASDVVYSSGTGQNDDTVKIPGFYMYDFVNFVGAYEWVKTDLTELPEGECFRVGNYAFNRAGQIYSANENAVYEAPDMDRALYSVVIDKAVSNDNEAELAYRILHACDRVGNFRAVMKMNCNVLQGSDEKIDCQVTLECDSVHNRERAAVDSLDAHDYSADYYADNYRHCVIHRGEYANDLVYNDDIDTEELDGGVHVSGTYGDAPMYSYSAIRSTVLEYLTKYEVTAIETKDKDNGSTTVEWLANGPVPVKYRGKITINSEGIITNAVIKCKPDDDSEPFNIIDLSITELSYGDADLSDADFTQYFAE